MRDFSSLDPWLLWQYYGILYSPDDGKFFVESGRNLFPIEDELRAIFGKEVSFLCVDREEFLARQEDIKKKHCQKNVSEGDREEIHSGVHSTLLHELHHWFDYGIHRGASDIHFEIDQMTVTLRMRIDGTLRTMHQFSSAVRGELSACLKTMANLDITEHFHPQDGRLHCESDGRSVECRISVLPTKNGESIVLRILDKQRLFPRLDDLTMDRDMIASIRTIMAMESGLFLVVGPTGSGKTTSIYAALQEINRSDIKMLTIEDPVEYELDGILQVPVDFSVGRTFSTVLRAFLRHDPDKILVGEIRDEETAKTALQAALTGHLVLSTLHTATAAEAMVRLRQMRVDQFLLHCCLRGILSQRLLRLNCPHCSEPMDDKWNCPKIFHSLARDSIKCGRGCEKCDSIGYAGRQAIFELCIIDDSMRKSLNDGLPLPSPQTHSLAEQALHLMKKGMVSPEEFLRQIPC
ncbi:MAG: GspE/PulE family protein [Puniceicoccales bacterium]|jgi:type II secretory ATPase GspE/PulE/Tfp pilus assembly ATPase PilB-like protein|nr:GspE/PulE family protein [Puniceicoccales bacterium]